MKFRKCAVFASMAMSLLVNPGCGYFPSIDTRLERALAKSANGDYAGAEAELAAVVKREPTHGVALLQLAKVELKLGRADAAASYLVRARGTKADSAELQRLSTEAQLLQGQFAELLKSIDANPQPADAHWLALRAAAQTGLKDYASAESNVLEAQRLAPQSAEVLLALAQLRAAQGRVADALAALDTATAVTPSLLRVWILRGTIALAQGRADAARADFQHVLDAKRGEATIPEQMQSLAGLAELYLAKNALANASEVVKKLRAVAPGSVLVHYMQGRLALQSGDAQKAVAELTAVTRATSNDAMASTLLGAALLAQGSREQAQATLSEVIAKNPDNSYARKLLAQAQLANNQADAARRTLTVAGRPTAIDAQADYLMAVALMKLGEVANAVPYLERSAAAAPLNIEVAAQLGRAYLAVGEFAKARATLETIPLARRDKTVQPLLVLSRIAGQNRADALHTLEQLVAGNATDAELVAVAGSYALKLGNAEAAARYFKQSLQLDASNVTAHLGAAETAAMKADYKSANLNLLAVLKIEPAHQPAFLALANIEQRQRNTAAARGWLEKAIAADPATTLVRLTLAQLEFKAGDAARAKLMLDQAVAVAVDKPAAAYAAGEAALGSGQTDEAAKRFAAAVQLGSKAAVFSLASVQLALNQAVEARQTLAQVTDAESTQQASAMLVALDAREGKFDQAQRRIADMKTKGLSAAGAAELDGDVAVASKQWLVASKAYTAAYNAMPSRGVAIKLFETQKALQAKEPDRVLLRWLERNPNDGSIRLALASWLQQAGRGAAAIAQYQLLLGATTEPNPVILNNLAWAYYEAGDKRALETARQAYQGNESRAEIADTYGWLLVESGDLATGTPILKTAMATANSNASLRYHLAVAYSRGNDNEAARHELNAVLASGSNFPERPAAERLLAKLHGR